MFEQINQPVAVIASFSRPSRQAVQVVPHIMQWQGRRYKLDTFGLYHPARIGNKIIHVFQFSSEGTAFRLELDSETLAWTLTEAYHDTGA